MPRYDYKCKQCGHEVEKAHSFKVTPEFLCPECEGSVMVKIFKTLNFRVKNTLLVQRLKEQHKKEQHMKQELRENHLLENVTPVASGTVEQVYKEVKSSGGAVRETMQRTIEENEAKTRKKQKNWQIGANKRVKERTLEKRERDAAEAAKKRSITVSTKK